VKEIKDETVCKKKIKMIIKEIVRKKFGNIKQELEDLRRMMRGEACGSADEMQRSYSEAVKEKKKKLL